ncbi:MAG: hypothetical protein O7D91_04340 [Planctomycetota bacterium]|nr:hypothetical protein [Planctomycetota bacterium]
METTKTQKRLNFYCQIMIVLLGAIAVRVWMMPVEMLPRAQAQFMDAGAQRVQLLKAVEKTNALLSEINSTLKGTIKVTIEGDENEAKASTTKRKKTRP